MNISAKTPSMLQVNSKFRIGVLMLFFLISINCTSGHKTLPPDVNAYLNEVLELLENKSVNKKNIDWRILCDSVFREAEHATQITETYAAISLAVFMLKDNHSYFRPVTEVTNDTRSDPLPVLTDELTPKDIGYIRLPFCIGTTEQLNSYISTIQYKLKQQVGRSLKGWVVDLRGNFGGNMWPMLLASEPLLGNDTLGYFVDADKNCQSWILKEGRAYINETLVHENLSYEKIDLTNQQVAVLIDGQTASSGEALAIAFKQRNRTKFFGVSTYGVSTGCVSHTLSDGSVINLAESIFADRTLKTYGNKVNPDTETTNPMAEAIRWIYEVSKD